MLSRLRSTSVDYKKQVVATGNPDYESFIRHWIEFALDERGIPIRKDVYPTRYMVQVTNGKIHWADTRKELEDIYGSGAESGILSFKFVPGTIYDNPPLMKADPTYISKLKSLPRVEMERLLLGSWYARIEAAGYFKREWIQEVIHPNLKAKQRVRVWDIAMTPPSEQNRDPDWTRGTLVSKDSSSVYTIEDLVSLRDRAHKVEELIFSTAENDGRETIISLPLDPGASAGAYAKDLQRKLGERGFLVRLQKPVKSKLTRFAPFSSIAQSGFVQVVKADWNKELYEELEIFDGNGKHHDDIADTLSDAMIVLNREINLPSFSLPDFTGVNKFNSTGIVDQQIPFVTSTIH